MDHREDDSVADCVLFAWCACRSTLVAGHRPDVGWGFNVANGPRRRRRWCRTRSPIDVNIFSRLTRRSAERRKDCKRSFSMVAFVRNTCARERVCRTATSIDALYHIACESMRFVRKSFVAVTDRARSRPLMKLNRTSSAMAHLAEYRPTVVGLEQLVSQ